MTPFEQACAAQGWGRPAEFLKAFHATAEVLGEDITVTDRQFRRWRAVLPPLPVRAPGASSTPCSVSPPPTWVSPDPHQVSS